MFYRKSLLVLTLFCWIAAPYATAEIRITGGGGGSAAEVTLDNGVDPPTKDSMTHGPYSLTFNEAGFSENSNDHRALASVSVVDSDGKSGGRATFEGSNELSIQEIRTQVNLDSQTSFGSVHSGSATFSLEFEIDASPAMIEARVTVFRDFGGESEFSAKANLGSASSNEVFEFVVSGTAEDDPNVMQLTDRFALPVGQYTLTIECDGSMTLPIRETPVETHSHVIVLGVFTISQEVDLSKIFWSANDGVYNVAENWEPQQIPGVDHTAVFDRDADYTVTIGIQATGRAIVERGEVAFEGGTYTLSGGTADTGSLVVGQTAADFANLSLSLDNLNTDHAIVGDEFLADGIVYSSESCDWINQGRLSVGKNGIGSVTIENNAKLSTGELRIGDEGFGDGRMTLRNSGMSAKGFDPTDHVSLTAGSTAIGLQRNGALVVESARLKTGTVEIGSMFGTGSATVTGDPPGELSWIAENLVVGKSGEGTFGIEEENGMRVHGDISMGVQATATGEVTLTGSSGLVTFDGPMTVGGSGLANLTIEGGSIAGASEVVIGESPQGTVGGLVTVRGHNVSGEASRFVVFDGPLRVGRTGTTPRQVTGGLSLEEGGEAICHDAFVGHRGGSGRVAVDADSKWTLTGALVTSSADATVDPPIPLTRALLFHHGFIAAQSITFEIGTEIEGDGVFEATDTIDYAGVSEPVSEGGSKGPVEFAVMTFIGDFNMERGGFILDVGGASESMTDRIAIIGDANITGGTITFNFVDGFLPQTGEMIPFLDISGNTTFENVQAAYTGAAEGFEFNLTEQDGMLMLEALSDAQPEPEPNADLNGDGGIDANDLFIFLQQLRESKR